MVNGVEEKVKLHNGVEMPVVGFGVFKISPGNETREAVHTALEAGYRSIDTATYYENEEDVGAAIQKSGIPRKEIFITTKVWPEDQGYEPTLRAFERSLEKLKTDYVDLYLIHWPEKGKSVETWRALETIYESRQARAIGLSNYTIEHIEKLQEYWKIAPMVNQVEFHPYLQQPELISYCRKNRILVEAWAPLMRGKVLQDNAVAKLAARYGKSAAQIILRWELQKGIIVIPKSAHKERVYENRLLFDFNLSPEDMLIMDGLDKNLRTSPDPHSIPF